MTVHCVLWLLTAAAAIIVGLPCALAFWEWLNH